MSRAARLALTSVSLVVAHCGRTDIELLARSASDCDLYVDNTRGSGSDANDGTRPDAPLATLTRAAVALGELAEPRRLCVLAGSYDESPSFTTSGAAGSRLELLASQGVRARGLRITADHVRVNGFTLGPAGGTAQSPGIVAEGNDILIDGNLIEDGLVRLAVTGDDVEVASNTMTSDGTDYIAIRFFGQRHFIHGNTSDDALFCWQTFASAVTTGAIVVDGNACRDARRACLDAVGAPSLPDVVIRNNICVGDGGGAALLIEDSTGCVMSNNVVDGGWPLGLAWTGNCDAVVNNLLMTDLPYGGGGSARLLDYNMQVAGACSLSEVHGRCIADPLLAGPTAASVVEAYTPLAGSPLIDAGTNEGVGERDLALGSRVVDGDGDGVAIADVGAVERRAP